MENQEERLAEARRGRAASEFAHHVRRQPTWHKSLLLVMLVLAVVGIVGQVRARVARPHNLVVDTSPTTVSQPSAGAPGAGPAGSRGFVSGAPRASDPGTATSPESVTTESTAPPDDMLTRASPYATKLGVGYVAGFVIGWVFRFFLKMMTMIALLAGALWWGLSYFRVVNVDLTPAKRQYDTAVHWAEDQGSKLKDAAIAHLPSGAATSVGLFFGFRRKHID